MSVRSTGPGVHADVQEADPDARKDVSSKETEE